MRILRLADLGAMAFFLFFEEREEQPTDRREILLDVGDDDVLHLRLGSYLGQVLVEEAEHDDDLGFTIVELMLDLSR